MHKSIDRCYLLEFVETKNVLVCVQIVAEASKRQQNTVLTTTACNDGARQFYGKLRKDNKM